MLFPFSKLLRVYGIATIVLSTLLLLIFGFTLGFQGQGSLLAALIWAIFSLFGLNLFYRHSGSVELTKDAIVLQRFGRKSSLLYKEIISVKDFDRSLPPNWVFATREKRLKLSTQLESLPLVYHYLRYRVPVLREQEAQQMPWLLRPKPSHIVGEVIALGLLSMGLLTWVWWGLFRRGPEVENQIVWLAIVLLVVLMVLAPFWLVLRSTYRVWRLTARADALEIMSLTGRSQTWPIQQIAAVRLTSRQDVLSTAPQQTIISHIISIEMKDKRKLIIEETHTGKWGISLTHFFYSLHALYAHEKIPFSVLGRDVTV